MAVFSGECSVVRIYAAERLAADQAHIYSLILYSVAGECFACCFFDSGSSGRSRSRVRSEEARNWFYLALSFRVCLLLIDSYPLRWRFFSFSRLCLSFCFILFSFLVGQKLAFWINNRPVSERILFWFILLTSKYGIDLPSGISPFSLK